MPRLYIAIEISIENAIENTIGNAIENAIGIAIENAIGNAIENTIGNAIGNAIGNTQRRGMPRLYFAIENVIRNTQYAETEHAPSIQYNRKELQ